MRSLAHSRLLKCGLAAMLLGVVSATGVTPTAMAATVIPQTTASLQSVAQSRVKLALQDDSAGKSAFQALVLHSRGENHALQPSNPAAIQFVLEAPQANVAAASLTSAAVRTDRNAEAYSFFEMGVQSLPNSAAANQNWVFQVTSLEGSGEIIWTSPGAETVPATLANPVGCASPVDSANPVGCAAPDERAEYAEQSESTEPATRGGFAEPAALESHSALDVSPAASALAPALDSLEELRELRLEEKLELNPSTPVYFGFPRAGKYRLVLQPAVSPANLEKTENLENPTEEIAASEVSPTPRLAPVELNFLVPEPVAVREPAAVPSPVAIPEPVVVPEPTAVPEPAAGLRPVPAVLPTLPQISAKTATASVAGDPPTNVVTGSVQPRQRLEDRVVGEFSNSHTLRANTHVHPNWIFTAPGTYEVNLRQTATLNTGETVSTAGTITFHVGGTGNADEGHFDIGTTATASGIAMLVKDDRSQPAAWIDPSELVFGVGDAARLEAPAGLEFIAKEGQTIWLIASTQVQGVPWVGANTMHPDLLKYTTGEVTWTLDSVNGPGDVAVFESGNFGEIVGQNWFEWHRGSGGNTVESLPSTAPNGATAARSTAGKKTSAKSAKLAKTGTPAGALSLVSLLLIGGGALLWRKGIGG